MLPRLCLVPRLPQPTRPFGPCLLCSPEVLSAPGMTAGGGETLPLRVILKKRGGPCIPPPSHSLGKVSSSERVS